LWPAGRVSDHVAEEWSAVVRIRLLGPPAIERNGEPAPPPRGRKSWALLAYLLLAERPPSRRHLAELLFGEADDPLGALRWTLAELRRALGDRGLFAGDPVGTGLGDGVSADVHALCGEPADPAGLLELDGELLDGLSVLASPTFESWLVVERHRLAATAEARLRQTALGLLAAGQPGAAVAYASRAVAHNPLDEGNHELLVRCLAVAGDRAAALRQVAVCQDTLRHELGIETSDALTEAAAAPAGSPRSRPASGRAAVTSLLEAGRAAIAAGAVQAGIDCLRRACADAAAHPDPALQGGALVALGGALVHALRGRDEEGAVVLHEAVRLATEAGDAETAVTAYRELGFVEVQAGRRQTAEAWLAKAEALATTDAQLGAVLGIRGMNASDMGDYPAAFRHLQGSVERAARGHEPRQQAWSLAILARAHLLRDERSQAAVALADALELVRAERWMAFLPWPEALKAELDLRAGRLDSAAEQLEHAWALATHLGDPCWEGMAARGLGLLSAARGDQPGAAAWLAEARIRCNRTTDRYQWVSAHVLDAVVGLAIDHGEEAEADRLADALASLAARGDMRELVVRAHLHRSRLGEPSALTTARMLAADIDNPALAALLNGHR
jgi:DNA-binding SARP family transcriptional activator